MPIKDGSSALSYHTENRIQVTRRILQKIATSGVRSPDPQMSVLGPWADAPNVYLNYHRAAYELGLVNTGQAARYIKNLNLGVSSNILIVGAGFGWSAEWVKRFMPGIGVTLIDSGSWIQSVKAQDERGDIEAALDDARHNSGSGEVVGVTGALRDGFIEHLDMGPRSVETILEEDGLSNGSRARIRQSGPFTHIITEHVLEWLHDSEAVNLSDALRQIDATAELVHRVSPYSDGGRDKAPEDQINWKRIGDATPVDTALSDMPWYSESDWQILLPDDGFI